MGVPTSGGITVTDSLNHFNPRHPWGCRLERVESFKYNFSISIHGTRGGADKGGKVQRFLTHISIHGTRGGADDQFLDKYIEFINISIHGTRGGADFGYPIFNDKILGISIHGTRGGADVVSGIMGAVKELFQSTAPVGVPTF